MQVQVLLCSLEQVRLFAGKFDAAVKRYKDTYYSDRSQVMFVSLLFCTVVSPLYREFMLDLLSLMSEQ